MRAARLAEMNRLRVAQHRGNLSAADCDAAKEKKKAYMAKRRAATKEANSTKVAARVAIQKKGKPARTRKMRAARLVEMNRLR